MTSVVVCGATSAGWFPLLAPVLLPGAYRGTGTIEGPAAAVYTWYLESVFSIRDRVSIVYTSPGRNIGTDLSSY